MSTTDVDVALTPLALELKAYFRARVACLQADPPCAVRPCARHHAEAATALGSVRCEACEGLGLDRVDVEPCIRCDGYGRIWPSASTAALGAPGGTAATSASNGVVGLRSRPLGPAAPPPETENRPGTLTPRAAYRPNVLGQNGA